MVLECAECLLLIHTQMHLLAILKRPTDICACIGVILCVRYLKIEVGSRGSACINLCLLLRTSSEQLT